MAQISRDTILAARDDVNALLRVGAMITAILTWAGLFNNVGWIFELMCHFRVQYAELQFVFSLGALWWFAEKREKQSSPGLAMLSYRRSELVVVIASLVLNLVLIVQLFLPASTVAKRDGTAQTLKVIQLNVNSKNERYDAVVAVINKYKADIVALQEVNEPWCTEMNRKLSEYPYKVLRARPDNFGVALFSKIPLKSCQLVVYGKAGVPTILAECEFAGAPLSVLCTHPVPPMTPEYFDLRNEQFAAMAKARSNWKPSVVLLGDLNCTSWSQFFQDLCRNAGLSDSRQGFGVQPSWPQQAFPLLIPLDHCLISRDLGVLDRKVCDDVGSDHYPVYVELMRVNAPNAPQL